MLSRRRPRQTGHDQPLIAGGKILLGEPLDEQLHLRPRHLERDPVEPVVLVVLERHQQTGIDQPVDLGGSSHEGEVVLLRLAVLAIDRGAAAAQALGPRRCHERCC